MKRLLLPLAETLHQNVQVKGVERNKALKNSAGDANPYAHFPASKLYFQRDIKHAEADQGEDGRSSGHLRRRFEGRGFMGDALSGASQT